MDELKRWLSLFGIRNRKAAYSRYPHPSVLTCTACMYYFTYRHQTSMYQYFFSLSHARPTYPSSVAKTAPNLSLRRSCSFFPSCTLFFVFPFPLSGLTVVTDGFNCWRGLGEVGTGEGNYWYLQCIYFVLYNT